MVVWQWWVSWLVSGLSYWLVKASLIRLVLAKNLQESDVWVPETRVGYYRLFFFGSFIAVLGVGANTVGHYLWASVQAMNNYFWVALSISSYGNDPIVSGLINSSVFSLRKQPSYRYRSRFMSASSESLPSDSLLSVIGINWLQLLLVNLSVEYELGGLQLREPIWALIKSTNSLARIWVDRSLLAIPPRYSLSRSASSQDKEASSWCHSVGKRHMAKDIWIDSQPCWNWSTFWLYQLRLTTQVYLND